MGGTYSMYIQKPSLITLEREMKEKEKKEVKHTEILCVYFQVASQRLTCEDRSCASEASPSEPNSDCN